MTHPVLSKYIPETALPLIIKWLKQHPIQLTVKKPRKTKLGDFRPARQGKPHRITVNGDLNQFHFLITLIHELAHVFTWVEFRNKVNPHGKEWKNIYSKMMAESMTVVAYPTPLVTELERHLNQPKASSCSDPQLYTALKQYDPIPSISLMEIEEGERFLFNKTRLFKKGKKRRSRYECIEISSGKLYLISGHASVTLP